ncbi:uncharacterized protein V1516DRAFT_670735 [Lipomyces oligophaga]|uniref:uncharacterized protein n=1 Tax=Lipomyces oligophaga TaxID=45792 RepID=UPI0034CE59CE
MDELGRLISKYFTNHQDKPIDYRQIIQDPELIRYFESSTPELRVQKIRENCKIHGIADSEAEKFISSINSQLKPIRPVDRQHAIEEAAKWSCIEFFDVMRECATPMLRKSMPASSLPDAPSKELCARAKIRYNHCLHTQTTILDDVGYRFAVKHTAEHSALRKIVKTHYEQEYGTARQLP